MKLFKFYLSIFVFIGLFFGIALLFPHKYKFESSIEINKPVEETFAYMSNLKNWEQWSAWNKEMDTSLIFFYSRESNTLGARQYFTGNLLGKGRFIINNIKPNDFLSYNLYMHEGEIKANGTFYFIQKNNTTQLTWVDSGDVGYNPIFRYMIPFKRSSTEAAFEEGLKRIKEKLENVR